MATSEERQLESLRRQQENILRSLKTSKTAASGEQQPSAYDMAAQQRLLKTTESVNKIENKILKDRWYGKEATGVEKEGVETGLVGKTLDALSKPLYAVVGAAEYATGKRDGNLFETMNKNVKTSKRTFGDVLKDTGLPNVVSAPLGLVLDITFDPANLATAGATALVPRVVSGLIKGTTRGGLTAGLKAAAKGAESRVLESVLTARNISRGASKVAKKTASKIVGATPEVAGKAAKTSKTGAFMRALEKRSISSADEYDALVGRDLLGNISSAGKIPGALVGKESKWRVSLGDLTREVAKKTPFLGKYFEYIDYNNAEWTRLAKLKDILIRTYGSEDEMEKGVKAFVEARKSGLSFDEAYEKVSKEVFDSPEALKRFEKIAAEPPLENPLDDPFPDSEEMEAYFKGSLSPEEEKIFESLEGVSQSVSSAQDIATNPAVYVSSDRLENALRLASEAELIERDKLPDLMEDLSKIIKRGELGETGVKWFDSLKAKTKTFKYQVKLGKNSVEIGDKIGKTLDTYAGIISMFKRGVVGASLTAWTNAIVGNPVMAAMFGINVTDPLYLKNIKKADSIIGARKGSDVILAEILSSGDILKTMVDNPTLFSRTTGLSPKVLSIKNTIERVIQDGVDAGLLNANSDKTELAKALGMALDELNESLKTVSGLKSPATANTLKEIEKTVRKAKPLRPSQTVLADIAGGKFEKSDFTTMISSEFFDSNVSNKWLSEIKRKAEESGALSPWKLLDLSFNKASEAYEGIDQKFKFGTMLYLTTEGVTEKELTKMSRFVHFEPTDFEKINVNGVRRYKMSGAKALESANEIYMNYNAMPAAVHLLRNLPLVGSPFMSFAYGMSLKTAKTLAYNPAIFNKVSFALNDLGASKSPLEKGVLSDPKYAYLQSPGMTKIGLPGARGSFFDTYTVYANLANMIPYYTLNMFTPNERKYSEMFSGKTVELIDKSPFLKDPVMSTIFDYLILPSIIDDSRPIGSFGQPLYPIDASGLEKTGYFVRSLADPFVPGFISPIAGTMTGLVAPGASQFMPSYRWRQVAEATQGKSAIGIEGSESALSRYTRSILGSMGVPIQSPVPLSYLPKDVKEEISEVKK